MRSVFVFALLGLVALASASVVLADADDAALMELGIDLSASQATTMALEPLPTYVTVKPLGHELTTIAKFPMMHEIQGEEAKDWQDIQGLLFREPVVASESSVDMKLDELEQQFNKIDTMPVPSPIAPAGSTLMPPIIKKKEGLPHPHAEKPRMQQKKKVAAAAPRVGAAAPTTPVAIATPPAAAPARDAKTGQFQTAAAARADAAPRQANGQFKAAPAAAPANPAAPASVAAASNVQNTISTVKLIDKRIHGLSLLFKRLKAQIGMQTDDKSAKANSAQRLAAAMKKSREEDAELKRRLAAKKARFAQVDMDAEAEAEAEAAQEADSLSYLEADADSEGEVDAESDAEVEAETEQESEAELLADAEAVDEILSEQM